jgi:uncharacterized protein (UPF0332 family)
MNAREFLDTAERLAQGLTEGDWRSAISRAYYFVFHEFGDFFLARGLNLGQGASAHFNLYAGLLNSGIPSVARLGSRVDDLRADRVTADYDLRRPMSQAWANATVIEARAVVAEVQTILKTTPAAQIVNNVHQYLRAIGRLGKTP